MFIQQAFKGQHKWQSYLFGSFIVFFVFMIAQGAFGYYLLEKAKLVNPNINLREYSLAEVITTSELPENLIVFLMLLSFAAGMIGLYIINRVWHNRTWRSLLTGRKHFDWSRFLFSFGIMAAIIIAQVLLSYKLHPEDFELQFQLKPFIVLFLISIVLVPLQAGFEEAFLRGYLLQGIGAVFKNRWLPLIVTSVGFGLMHGSNPEVAELGTFLLIYYIGTGFFLGILTLMDDGLELAWGFHAANNLIQILLVTSTYSVFQSPSILKDISQPAGALQEMIFPLLIVYPVLIIVFAKKYHWENWKEKLLGKVEVPRLTYKKKH